MPHAAAAHSPEWFTTEEAALALNRSKRRTLELIQEKGLTTKHEMRGRVLVQLVDAGAIRKLRDDRDKPRPRKQTIDVPGNSVARREPVQESRAIAGLAGHLAKLSAWQEKPHRWVTLSAAADFTGLTRTLLEDLCEKNRLPSYWDGPPSRQRRMVKIADLQSLSA